MTRARPTRNEPPGDESAASARPPALASDAPIDHSGPLVIKLGGDAIEAPETADALFAALAQVHRSLPGRLVLVHGGGKAVDRHFDRLGLKTQRRDGIRLTPEDQIGEVVAVLAGSVNKSLVGALQRHGVPAVGLCLGDGGAAVARADDTLGFDPGRVGRVIGGDGRVLLALLDAGFVPVLSSIGLDGDGRALNLNADDAAAGVAAILRARGLVLLTDVHGILGDRGERLERTTRAEIEQLIKDGVITGGMIPKATAAARAADTAGVPAVIASWMLPDDLARLALGESIGTQVMPTTSDPGSASSVSPASRALLVSPSPKADSRPGPAAPGSWDSGEGSARSAARSARSLVGRDLLTLADLDPSEIDDLFNTADRGKREQGARRTPLAGKAIVLLFEKPSLRTRVTFEVGPSRLGATAMYFDHSKERIGQRESVRDYAKNLERWVDAIVARVYSHAVLRELAEHASIPVVNALSDWSHPCQALADYFTLRERVGGLRGFRLAYVGDGNNVCHSLMQGAAMLGVDLTVVTPPGYEPSAAMRADVEPLAASFGGRVRVTNDLGAAADAQAVYTDTWVSMGVSMGDDSEAERRMAAFRGYQVNAALMGRAAQGAFFMHCLPAHRGVEVTDEVMDSAGSLIYEQAENRMHVQNSLLLHILGCARE